MTPVFYVLIRKLTGERPLKHAGPKVEILDAHAEV
jgi:multidrug efflux pump